MDTLENVGAWGLVAVLLTWLQRTLEKKIDALIAEVVEVRKLHERSEAREVARAALRDEWAETTAVEAPAGKKARRMNRAKSSTVVGLDGEPLSADQTATAGQGRKGDRE